MYLAYVDESEDQYNFVLATIAINESQVLGTAKGVNNVEEKHFGMLSDSERPVLFHCTTIRSPALHLARDQLKSKDRQLALLISTWDYAKRKELLQDIYNVFASHLPLNLALFAIVIDKQLKGGENKPVQDANILRHDRAFEELYAMFHDYLRRHHQNRVDRNRNLAGYGTQKGLFLHDRSSNRGTLRSHAAVCRRMETLHGTGYNIVETPVFLPSKDSRNLQLVDFAANAILGRYGPDPDQDAEFFDSALVSKIDREGPELHRLLHIIPDTSPRSFCLGRHYRSLTPP